MDYSIFLCEGESDAILIGYYLDSKLGWNYIDFREIKRIYKREMPIFKSKLPSSTEYWHTNGDRLICLLSIDGNAFDQPLSRILEFNRLSQEDIFCTIALFTDHDDSRTEEEFITNARNVFRTNGIQLTDELLCNKWVTSCEIVLALTQQKYQYSIFASVMPIEEEGTLETFLLSSLAQNNEIDAKVVAQCNNFIQHIDCTECNPDGLVNLKYLSRRGDRPKAKFATFFAVVNPRKVFCTGHEMILSAAWEKYDSVNKYFSEFISRL